MNDQQIESEIQKKGLTAPRVTPERIEEVISCEYYFTADEGIYGAAHNPFAKQPDKGIPLGQYPLSLLTFCVLVLRNGHTVTGESACVSPENFDADIGRKIARENAVQKIWGLEGYALRERLANGEATDVPMGARSDKTWSADAGQTVGEQTLEQVCASFISANFGQALHHVKNGGKAQRAGWNGKGMYITLIRAGNAMHQGHDMQDCLALKTVRGTMQPGWLASQEDMLANDWQSV